MKHIGVYSRHCDRVRIHSATEKLVDRAWLLALSQMPAAMSDPAVRLEPPAPANGLVPVTTVRSHSQAVNSRPRSAPSSAPMRKIVLVLHSRLSFLMSRNRRAATRSLIKTGRYEFLNSV